MLEEYELIDFGVEEDKGKWEISDNWFLVNLMTEQAAEIMDIFERFLKEKGIKIPNEEKKGACNPAILYGDDYYLMENEVKEILEEFLHQARSEFEDEEVD